LGCVDDASSDSGEVIVLGDANTDAGTGDGAMADSDGSQLDLGSVPDSSMSGQDGALPVTGECAPDPRARAVHGVFYVDEDESDRSTYAGGPTGEDSPIEGELELIGSETAEIRTCDDGSYEISGLEEGVFLVQPLVQPNRRCTTANCPGRFARAVQEGRAPVMLTFGDSIAVIGDQPIFPERVRTLFSQLTDIENRNVAVAGSTSTDWLPNRRYFSERLTPQLAEADLLIITLGGNDMLQYVSNIGIPNDIPAAIEGARLVVLRVIENVSEILTAVRAVNPDADIAYCLYADYSQATEHPIWGLVGSFLGPDTVSEVLELARSNFPTNDRHLMLVDMFGAAQGLPLHDYLYDQLHFNDLGQTLYAEEVFETLGGVLIGNNPLGEMGATPIGLRRNYGLSPNIDTE